MGAVKIFALAFLVGSCGQFFEQKKLTENAPVGGGLSSGDKAVFEGEFTAEDGQTVHLQDLSGRPVVLMFASMFCSYCIEETTEILKTMNPQTRNTPYVNFVTILLDSTDARKWRDQLPTAEKPGWLHGYDNQENFALYKRFFPQVDFPLTPSVVLFHPVHQRLLAHVGKDSPEEGKSMTEFIQSWVGRW